MTFVKSAASALALCVALGFATAANAADAKATDCNHMAKQVSTAFDSAKPGDTVENARAEERMARQYCASTRYAQGVAHYEKALELLGKS